MLGGEAKLKSFLVTQAPADSSGFEDASSSWPNQGDRKSSFSKHPRGRVKLEEARSRMEAETLFTL